MLAGGGLKCPKIGEKNINIAYFLGQLYLVLRRKPTTCAKDILMILCMMCVCVKTDLRAPTISRTCKQWS